MKKFSLQSLIIAISMIGFGCATQNGATGKMDSATAIAKIAELQNRAQSAAEAFKQSHPTSDATYIAVRSKYKDAAAKNHGYLAAVQAGILQRQRNFDTPSYHNIATGAADAEKEFVDLAEKNTPAAAKPMGFAVGIGAAADLLIKAGIAIWEAHVKDETAKAKAVADSLKQQEWPSWESVGATSSSAQKRTKNAQLKKTEKQ